MKSWRSRPLKRSSASRYHVSIRDAFTRQGVTGLTTSSRCTGPKSSDSGTLAVHKLQSSSRWHLPQSRRHYSVVTSTLERPPEAILEPESARDIPIEPHEREWHDSVAWSRILDNALKQTSGDGSTEDSQRGEMLADILGQAWTKADLDLLSYVGLQQQRWDDTLQVIDILLETFVVPFHHGPGRMLSTIKWPSPRTLEQSTQSLRTTSGTYLKSQPSKHNEDLGVRLDDILRYGGQSKKETRDARRVLGQIWRTLGNLILASTNHYPEQSNLIMPRVLWILARLHRYGFIPKDVYESEPNADPAVLQQPPALRQLSAQILNALSDAEFESQFQEITAKNASKSSISSLFMWKRRMNNRPLTQAIATELWLEFTLWCCLHGGWHKEGVYILKQIEQMKDAGRWSLICWRDIMQAPDERWDEYVESRLSQSRSGNRSGQKSSNVNEEKRLIIQRTISSEVVVAYVDGLVSALTRHSGGPEEVAVEECLDNVLTLQKLLDREGMSLGTSSWDAIILRFANLLDVELETNPRLMESILELTESFGKEMLSSNAPSNTSGLNGSASYILDGSAAIIGIYHRVIQSYIDSQNVVGAFRAFLKLRSFTDENKKSSIEMFFRDLKRMTSQHRENKTTEGSSLPEQMSRQVDFQSSFPGIEFPSFSTQLPSSILAGLLDLSVEKNELGVARHMLSSQEVEGPLIAPERYGDSILGPALIRYAFSDNDDKLLAQVAKAQSAEVTGRALLAVCQARIQDRNFAAALEVTATFRTLEHVDVSTADLSRIVKAIVRVWNSLGGSSDKMAATQILEFVFSDTTKHLWRRQSLQRSTGAAVLLSIDESFAPIGWPALAGQKEIRTTLSISSFNLLLAGAVRAYGSDAGRRLWQTWCEPVAQRELTTLQSGKKTSSSAIAINKERQSEHAVVFEGYISPHVSTVDVIIEEALREMQDESGATKSHATGHPVLEWASSVLRSRFHMKGEELAYHLQGYEEISHKDAEVDGLPYSGETMRLWQALSGAERRNWRSQQEARLRNFANRRLETELHIAADLPTTERSFIRALASDLKLVAEEDKGDGQLHVRKAPKSAYGRVPDMHIRHALRQLQARSGDAAPPQAA